MVYVDSSKPGLVDGFILKTIIPMVEGVKDQALEMKMIGEGEWKKGIEELYGIPSLKELSVIPSLKGEQ